jgi:hypothetical protein
MISTQLRLKRWYYNGHQRQILFSGQHLRYDWRKSKLERKWQITIKIKRNGAEQILQGKIKLPYEEKEEPDATDATKDVKDSLVKG